MNIRRTITAVAVSGLSVFTGVGLASVAHAEPPTSVSMSVDDEVTANATRRFWIDNYSSASLYVYGDAWTVHQRLGWDSTDPRLALPETPHSAVPGERPVLDPEDSTPAHGYELRPGESIEVEVAAWKGHALALWFRTADESPRSAALTMYVHGMIRYSYAYSDDFRVDAGGQNITFFNKR